MPMLTSSCMESWARVSIEMEDVARKLDISYRALGLRDDGVTESGQYRLGSNEGPPPRNQNQPRNQPWNQPRPAEPAPAPEYKPHRTTTTKGWPSLQCIVYPRGNRCSSSSLSLLVGAVGRPERKSTVVRLRDTWRRLGGTGRFDLHWDPVRAQAPEPIPVPEPTPRSSPRRVKKLGRELYEDMAGLCRVVGQPTA